ncbi:MAG TPA: AI-2E family transporter, partial [Flavobacterium sp.]|nr:AI-2E family transporter [Flavobacterium sp.]
MKSISIYRLNAMLLLLILTTIILYYGKTFLVPLFFAILLAMLLLPVCRKLERWGMGRIASTLVGILIFLTFVALIIGVVAAQGVTLAEDFPQMQEKGQEFINTAQDWITSRYGISSTEQAGYAKKGMDKMSQSGGKFFSGFMSGLMSFLTSFVLILLYFFFLMWKREKYKEFILRLVND